MFLVQSIHLVGSQDHQGAFLLAKQATSNLVFKKVILDFSCTQSSLTIILDVWGICLAFLDLHWCFISPHLRRHRFHVSLCFYKYIVDVGFVVNHSHFWECQELLFCSSALTYLLCKAFKGVAAMDGSRGISMALACQLLVYPFVRQCGKEDVSWELLTQGWSSSKRKTLLLSLMLESYQGIGKWYYDKHWNLFLFTHPYYMMLDILLLVLGETLNYHVGQALR